MNNMLIRILEQQDWCVDYDKEHNVYRASYFQDNHFVDECLFDAYKEELNSKGTIEKLLKLETESDDFGVCEEKVYDGNKLLFNVYDLTDHPEDATISRNLFSAHQFLQAVRYGIKLHKQGYDDVGYTSSK